jgi:hypothetical protein
MATCDEGLIDGAALSCAGLDTRRVHVLPDEAVDLARECRALPIDQLARWKLWPRAVVPAEPSRQSRVKVTST